MASSWATVNKLLNLSELWHFQLQIQTSNSGPLLGSPEFATEQGAFIINMILIILTLVHKQNFIETMDLPGLMVTPDCD